MGVGYTTIMYDAESVEEGIADIGACRYDGVEIGLPKLRDAGSENVRRWLDNHDLDLYCVMSEWLESTDAVDRVATDAELVAGLGAEFLGLLPPQRSDRDDVPIEAWFGQIADAAAAAGVTPLIHHHGATHVESPDEMRTGSRTRPTMLVSSGIRPTTIRTANTTRRATSRTESNGSPTISSTFT